MSTPIRSNYLAQDAMAKLGRRCRIQRIWGWILTAFFGLAVAMSLFGQDPAIRDGLIVYVGLLIPSVILLVSSFRTDRLLQTANRYGAILAADRDGMVTLDELIRQTGLPAGTIFAQLDTLFRRGLLQNCTLQRGDNPGVLLADAVLGARTAGFVSVRCESCGGVTRICAGSIGKCEYCGSPIRGIAP